MLKNRTCDRPQDWGLMEDSEKDQWNELTDNIEQFYRDLKSHKHISPSLNFRRMTLDEQESFAFFYKTMEAQDRIYNAGNMFSKILFADKSRELVELSKGMLNDLDLLYAYISMFAYFLVLSYESNLNVIKKTITTSNLKKKNGAPWNKSIEKTGPEDLFNLLEKYSVKPVQFLKNIIFKNKPLRNAFSHGLFWYQEEQIYWISTANSIEANNISFEKFIQLVRAQSVFSMCLIWVGGKLIAEGFFKL